MEIGCAVLLLLSLLPSAPALAGSTEELSCQAEIKFQDGHIALHSAAITVRNESIVSLYVESVNIFDHDGGTYGCTLDTDDREAKAVWYVFGDVTELNIDMPCGKGAVAITRVGAAYVIAFNKMNRLCCGTAVDWPVAITISRTSDECKVHQVERDAVRRTYRE